jgi:DNA processing protein
MNECDKIYKKEYPTLLHQVSGLPLYMYIQGTFPSEEYRYLCVIGARQHSIYGEDACRHLIRGLKGHPVVIVSGLALGIDSIAHETALEVGLPTVAFPGSGLSRQVLYPKARQHLAERILSSGGALVSPFEPLQAGAHWTFPVRNRLMAGVSHATLIIEGKEGSGTLLTARHALEFSRDVMIVPGSIFSDLSYGPHLLMRDGAYPVTRSEEVLDILGIEHRSSAIDARSSVQESLFTEVDMSPLQINIVDILTNPLSRDELIRRLATNISLVNSALSELELQGVVEERGGMLRVTRS